MSLVRSPEVSTQCYKIYTNVVYHDNAMADATSPNSNIAQTRTDTTRRGGREGILTLLAVPLQYDGPAHK